MLTMMLVMMLAMMLSMPFMTSPPLLVMCSTRSNQGCQNAHDVAILDQMSRQHLFKLVCHIC
jgi:hypothetical protein